MPIVEKAPLFIIGMPRSGTTLLRLVLNAHPEIAISTETHYFTHFKLGMLNRYPLLRLRVLKRIFVHLNYLKPRLVTQLLWRTPSTESTLAQLTAYHFFKVSGLHKQSLKQYLKRPTSSSYYQVYNAWLRAYAQKHDGVYFGDKTPINALFIEEIKAIYPQAHFIQIIRNPFNVMASLKNVQWESVNWNLSLLKSRIRLWKRITTKMAHNGSAITIFFEDLIADLARLADDLCCFLGLSFHENMLHPEQEAARYTDGMPWQEKNLTPVNESRATSTIDMLSANEIELIKAELNPYLQCNKVIGRYHLPH